MQLSGLELERVYAYPRTKPLSGDELGLLGYLQRTEGLPALPPPVNNPDNPLRYPGAPWSGKDIFNTRDILNRRANKIIAKNKVETKSFARQVLIHLGFTLPEIIERAQAQAGMAGLDQVAPPTTAREPVLLTSDLTARTLAAPATLAPQMDIAKYIPWLLLALSVVRTFKGKR